MVTLNIPEGTPTVNSCTLRQLAAGRLFCSTYSKNHSRDFSQSPEHVPNIQTLYYNNLGSQTKHLDVCQYYNILQHNTENDAGSDLEVMSSPSLSSSDNKRTAS